MVPKGMADRIRLDGYHVTFPEPVPILLIVKVGENSLFAVPTDELKQAWQEPLRRIFP